jgi:hypothetical protein
MYSPIKVQQRRRGQKYVHAWQKGESATLMFGRRCMFFPERDTCGQIDTLGSVISFGARTGTCSLLVLQLLKYKHMHHFCVRLMGVAFCKWLPRGAPVWVGALFEKITLLAIQ